VESVHSIDYEENQIPTFNKIKMGSKNDLPASKKRNAIKELRQLEMKKKKIEQLKSKDAQLVFIIYFVVVTSS
jgi:hypothetical protein